ncbi:MAG: porin [Burkholderiaceae bacterium]|nr:porin [Burkholderiaceae bacterium]
MMRKSALAIALTLAFPIAHAQGGPTQSGVQLYGIVDVGMERVDNGDVSVTRLTSGISTGSRWGIRGSEDLGGGYRALFTLENRFEVDNGTTSNRGAIFFCPSAPALCPGVVGTSPAIPGAVVGGMSAVNTALLQAVSTVNSVNALFDRQAFAGLVTPYGAILGGRQYTPNYEVLIKYNSFADSFAGNPGQIATINIRANNALQYRAELSGFTLSLMYGFGGSEGNRSERTTVGRGDDFYGVNVQYNAPTFGVGVGYNRNNTVTFAAPTESRKGLETYSVGGTATLGGVKLFATYLKAKNENPVLSPVDIQNIVISTGGNLAAINNILGGLLINRFDVDALRGMVGPTDLDVYHLGLNWTVGNGTLMAALNQSKDSARSLWATADAKVDQIGLAYMYNLSKRTQLYGAYAVANNKDQARIALGAACCTGGWTTAPGEDSTSLQIGMRHTF